MKAPERLILLPDYSCDPISLFEDGVLFPLEDLKLSDWALAAVLTWSEWFEHTQTDYGRRREGDRVYYFDDASEERLYFRAGVRLWRLLRTELSGRFEVALELPGLPGTFWSEDELRAAGVDPHIFDTE